MSAPVRALLHRSNHDLAPPHDVTPPAGFNPNVCAPFPRGELLSTHNSICNISEYNGGLYCCHDQSILLDADQPLNTKTDKWRMKFRFHFQEYTNQTNTFRVWWSTEAYNNEYNVPKSTADCLDPSTDPALCTHVIKAQFTGRDLFGPSGCMSSDPAACGDTSKIQNEYGGNFQMTYAAFHCHAPACIKGELWNADTGELICRNTAVYGSGMEPSDEKGYVLATCWPRFFRMHMFFPSLLFLFVARCG